VTRKTGEIAFNLCWKYNISHKDSIHIASALEYPENINFQTYDKQLLNKTEIFECDKRLIFEEPRYQPIFFYGEKS
jgi:hypothetical protein